MTFQEIGAEVVTSANCDWFILKPWHVFRQVVNIVEFLLLYDFNDNQNVDQTCFGLLVILDLNGHPKLNIFQLVMGPEYAAYMVIKL